MQQPLDARRRAIAADAQQRAMAWQEPDEDGGSAPARRPATTSGVPVGGRTSGGGLNDSPPLARSANGLPAAMFPTAGGEVTPFQCPQCRHRYDASESPPAGRPDQPPPSRLPVLVIPCGHTLCRECLSRRTRSVSSSGSGATPPPVCPLCAIPITATAFNRAIMAALPHFEARQRVDAPAEARSAAASDLAPLPPTVRRAVHEYAVDLNTAERAEHAARIGLSHYRLARLRAGEVDVALQELEDAITSSQSQSTVHVALGRELGQIEAEIKRLELERQVVVAQLTDALQRKAHGEVRVFECTARHQRLGEVAAKHDQFYRDELQMALQLVPSENLAAALSNA